MKPVSRFITPPQTEDADLTNRLVGLRSAIERADQQLEANKAILEQQGGAQKTLEEQKQQIDANNKVLSDQMQRISENKAKIVSLLEQQANHTERMSNSAGEFEKMADAQQELQKKIEVANENLKTRRAEVDNLEQKIKELTATTEELQRGAEIKSKEFENKITQAGSDAVAARAVVDELLSNAKELKRAHELDRARFDIEKKQKHEQSEAELAAIKSQVELAKEELHETERKTNNIYDKGLVYDQDNTRMQDVHDRLVSRNAQLELEAQEKHRGLNLRAEGIEASKHAALVDIAKKAQRAKVKVEQTLIDDLVSK